MTTTTMHFGPEWMRTKQGSSRPAPSPPLANTPAPPGNSTYSALVTPATNPPQEGRDVAHPFRYSKEEMLRIYKEGGGRGGLGLEVERWEGIVREVGYDPIGLKEMSDGEKKLFGGPLNSEARRRPSTDFLSPLTTSGLAERPKINHTSSGAGSPMRERIGFMGRRRGDSTDQAPLTLPRKLSLSNMQSASTPSREPAQPSPRVRPGFDGVLSDTWSSRRREGTPKTGTGAGKSDKEADNDARGPDIKEEEEHGFEHSRETSGGTSGSEPKSESNVGVNGSSLNQLNGQLGGISISGRAAPPPAGAPPSQSPPGLVDLSKVEWSYLDPQGKVQGPFIAETMQRWYNEGYFQPSLPMKRTHLDTEWTPVGELVCRAGDQPVFLSPLVHATPPPGLARAVENAVPERHSPYQPVPTRSIRTSTLDSYLQNGSSAPESPSSSLSGSRFVNGSPDAASFENRDSRAVAQLTLGTEPRMPFASPNVGLTTTPQRRATVSDAMEQPFGNRGFGIGRAPADSGLGFGVENPSIFTEGLNGSPFAQRPLQEPHMNGFTGSSTLNGQEYGAIGGINSNQGTPSRVLNRDAFGRSPLEELQPGLVGSFSNTSSPFVSHAQVSYPQTPLSQYVGQDNRSLQPITPISDRSAVPYPQQLQQSFSHTSSYPTTPQSPWASQDSPAFRRPGPFDAGHPTVNNVYVVPPIAHTPSFNRAQQPSEQSPWRAPHPPSNDSWGTPGASLTVANLGQHDEQLRQAELQHQQVTNILPDNIAEPEPVVPVMEEKLPQPIATPVIAPVLSDVVVPPKSRRKSAAQTAQVAPKAPKAAPPVPPAPAPVKPPSPVPQAEAKSGAWAIEEDRKTTAPSLREIQDAEAKKTGARKTAERERDRERVLRASSQSEDFQPFTTSWGLPTSQAGTRTGSAPKETSTTLPLVGTTPTSSPATPPVWTAKAPAAKKTMKEIQEEEELKKKAAKEKESVAAAARRAYADTTTKAAPPSTGGAWTTVGVGGKTSTAVVAARPTTTPVASAKTVPTTSTVPSSPSVSASRSTIAVQVARPPTAAKSAVSEEEPVVSPGPSLDFLKWLGDSLKGLNNSVNLEEISSMLLSFPLEADSNTMEIISDLIYANSTTLDGRRFASEFVSRRKADAFERPKGVTTASASKQVSIADIVKSQPKPAQSEWGGFKVVNNKGKKKATRS